MEQLYQKCLEFLDKHETKKLSKMHFNELWLTTDKFSYSLNNIRKKGHGKDYLTQERPLFPTYIVATVDSHSRYAFRTDLAFDYNVTADDIESDIEIFKDNHVYNFAQKNARYRYSYYGATTNDTTVKENEVDNYIDQCSLHLRKDYIDVFHVNTTYTSYAHFWLIRDILNVDKINYVSDEDNSNFNQIRRRASILERPLVSGRGEGKSFIYSNFNPKYANYILTILRTYLNFCDTFNTIRGM